MEAAEAIITITDVTDDILDYKRLNELVEFQRKNNPALKDKSLAEIAEDSGMCETTYKGILKGRNRNPRVATLTRMLKGIGGGSIDRLVGLAPPRDFRSEEAAYDKTLVEALQARLDGKTERIEEYKEQVERLEAETARLRLKYLDETRKTSAQEEQCKQAEEYKVRLRRFRHWLCFFVLLFILAAGLIIYILWDVSNPNAGLFGGIIWR